MEDNFVYEIVGESQSTILLLSRLIVEEFKQRQPNGINSITKRSKIYMEEKLFFTRQKVQETSWFRLHFLAFISNRLEKYRGEVSLAKAWKHNLKVIKFSRVIS